jgi:hypothetical protein
MIIFEATIETDSGKIVILVRKDGTVRMYGGAGIELLPERTASVIVNYAKEVTVKNVKTCNTTVKLIEENYPRRKISVDMKGYQRF